MHQPITIYIDISEIEDPIEFYCPVCGKAWNPGNPDRYCEHVALDFTPECAFIAERFMNEKYDEDAFLFLDDIFEKGCEEQLMVYEIHSEGIACGPVSETHYFGYSLQEWAKNGVAFE